MVIILGSRGGPWYGEPQEQNDKDWCNGTLHGRVVQLLGGVENS